MLTPKLEIIPFREFAEGMRDHWKGDPKHTPVYNNPFNMSFYHSERVEQHTILFPVKYTIDGEDAAFSSVYNISHTHIRTRGIYVVPKFRGHGLGYRLMKESWDLFPKSFRIGVEIFKESVFQKFIDRGMQELIPNERFWSPFSKSYMRLLYERRVPMGTRPEIINESMNFIEENHEKYSLGGTNNLNVQCSDEQWESYVKENQGKYPEFGDLIRKHLAKLLHYEE